MMKFIQNWINHLEKERLKKVEIERQKIRKRLFKFTQKVPTQDTEEKEND
jgi:hypothetical protein